MKDAVVLENVSKFFKRTSLKKDHTTLKTELVRLFTGRRKLVQPEFHIEALKGVDLVVPRGRTVGIIGRNGSGKSTLLKLITGIYTPSGGKLEVNGRISALLELGAGFHPDFTGRENILINGIILGMSRAEVKARMDTIIEFSELGGFIDEPVRTYSSGMFMRLAFAVATHVDPDILIIDEILSVGDEHFSRKSMAKMNEFKRSGRTIILVTHGLGTVESWCDLAVWIDGGRTRLAGNPVQVVAEYRKAVAAAEEESQRTGHSALSAPGLALPDTAPAPPPKTVAQVLQVRLRDATGAQPPSFSAEGRLDALIDFQLTETMSCEFSAELVTPQGQILFGATLNAGELQPGKGTVRLSFPRLGLGEGSWDLVCAVHGPGQPAASTLRTSLTVSPFASARGLTRPEFSWAMEPRS